MADRVAVASSIYNLAGDEGNRIDFLKSLVLGGVLQKTGSLGKIITQGYLDGPAIRFRNFLRWTRKDLDFITKLGNTQGSLRGVHSLDFDLIKQHIPILEGEAIERVNMARIETADISYWVSRYLAQTHPEITGGYSYRFDRETKTVTITFPDEVIETFSAEDYVPDARYLYVHYLPATVGTESQDPPEMGEFETLPGEFPSLDGWKEKTELQVPLSAELGVRQTTVLSYSDGRPDETVVNESFRTVGTTKYNNIYYSDSYKGQGPGEAESVYSERQWLETELSFIPGSWVPVGDPVVSSQELPGGVIRTATATSEAQRFKPLRRLRGASSEVIHRGWLPSRYFLYQEGAGIPGLDALFIQQAPTPMGDFFPAIPFRYENKPVGTEEMGATSWWIRTDTYASLTADRIYLRGGPVGPGKEKEQIEVASLDRVGEAWEEGPWDYRISTSEVPLYRVLGAKNAQYRIYTPMADTWSEWKSFLESPWTADWASHTEYHSISKKAFKKAFNADFDQVQEAILHNENIGHVDHVYAVFGASLNVKENACRKYIYKFFQHLLNSTSNYTAAEESQWIADLQAAGAKKEAWEAWRKDTTEKPPQAQYEAVSPRELPEIPWQSIQIESTKEGISNYHTELRWAFMHETFGTGLLKPEAKKGELWFEVLENPVELYEEEDEENNNFNQKIALCWQETDDSWRKLIITGLQHVNRIYGDMKIITSAKTALESTEESPFLVPLHETIYRSMSLVDATQMATACCFLVMNSYEVDKEEWYETDWFKVIVISAIVAVSVATALATGGTSLGLGGISIVAMLTGAGLSLTAAIVLTATASALTGLLLSWLISQGATALFGEKWGPLVGAIFLTVFTMGLAGGGLLEAFDALSRPEGWMALAFATGNGVASILQVSAQEVAEETAQMLEEYGEKTAELQRLYNESLNPHRIDPTIVNRYIDETTERPDHFLQRTLMTGSDIVEVTLRSIENFVADRLRLEMP